MAGTQLLRLLVNERLAAAAEEILGLVEKTLAEYQEELLRSKREIIQLKGQLEQLTVLKPQVLLVRADIQSLTGEILPSQQPDLPPLAETYEIQDDSPQVKEEQVDFIIPHLTDDSSEDVKVGLGDSETSQADYQLPPNVSTITVTLHDNHNDNDDDDDDDEWNGIDGSFSCGPSHSDDAFLEHDHAPIREKACRFCGMQFYKDVELVRHTEEFHMGEKAFKCPECDKEFARKDHLGVHLRVHTGERPHKCPFCKRTFAQSSNLNVHLRRHTGEKPYFCNTCGKMVAHSYHLKMCGMKEVRGERTFRCLVCGKKFHTASDLQVHEKIHEARKPYGIV